MKEYVLTWGDLGLYELETEKSAEVIVPVSHEPLKDKEVSQGREGLNIESRLNSIGRLS